VKKYLFYFTDIFLYISPVKM